MGFGRLNVLWLGNVGARFVDSLEVWSNEGENGQFGPKDDCVEGEGGDECRRRRRRRSLDIGPRPRPTVSEEK